ncbi:alpha/beta hydrolase family protein [Tabrizicola sp. BL-A-41-H6]|uniref:alpha/beta hydrolase family protein n=1 Tax=Tabrizicola sp. BL-A-41-H6 TaxID=3421107 RepID=UPI003D67E6E0
MRWMVVGLAMLAGAAQAEVTEERVTIASQGKTMVGTLALPEGGPAPVVLLFHGFTGTRDELPIPGTEEGVFSRTARLLAEAGYASLRVDFIGSGESDGDFADTTFEGQVADGLAALAFAQGDARVKGDELRVIGWSQGGLVATAVAGRSDVPKSVALWAAVADPLTTFTGILGAEAVAAGQKTGDVPLKITLPWGAEIGLKQGYFDQLTIFKPTDEIASYAGPLFVAQGSIDTTVLPVAQEMLLAAHEGEEEAFTREMDHVFNVFTSPDTLDEMVAATIAFFKAH